MGLGIGMGAGKRRRAGFLRKRLLGAKRTVSRHVRLRKSRVDTVRLFKAGGNASMSYGEAVVGVSSQLLYLQRQTAAAAAVPGAAGKNVDCTLFVADVATNTAKLDPAYHAHRGPIVAWASAVWEQ